VAANILLVEDMSPSQRIQFTSAARGFSVRTRVYVGKSSDGNKRHHFDLILLDVQLPTAWVDFCAEFRRIWIFQSSF